MRTIIANAKKDKLSSAASGPDAAVDSKVRTVDEEVLGGPSEREHMSTLPLRLRRTTWSRSWMRRGTVIIAGVSASTIWISEGVNHWSANKSSAIRSGNVEKRERPSSDSP